MKFVNRAITAVSIILAGSVAFYSLKAQIAENPHLLPNFDLPATPLSGAHTGVPESPVTTPAIDNGYAPQGQGAVDGVKALQEQDIKALAKAVAAELSQNNFVASEIKRDPKIVAEALVLWGRMQQGDAPEILPGDVAPALLVAAMDPATAVAVGANDAAFSAVEFLDVNCPHCRHSIPAVLAWIDQNPGVRVLFRELPVIAEQSQDAARVAMALGQQGLYRTWLEKVAAWQGGVIDAAVARQIAQEIGADMARLDASAASTEIAKTIAGNLELGANLGITGTPAFVIGNKLLIGSASTLFLTDFAAQQGAPMPKKTGPVDVPFLQDGKPTGVTVPAELYQDPDAKAVDGAQQGAAEARQPVDLPAPEGAKSN